MGRLGRNRGCYCGETIPIDTVLDEVRDAALAAGWQMHKFLEAPGLALRAYYRSAAPTARRIYISAGVHGDEPSGPLAILQALRDDEWPEANIWVMPCLNPAGFRLNTRGNEQGIDLNRDYREPRSLEVAAHVRWLESLPPFDLSLLLHEDWEADGFYVYELNPDHEPSLSETMVDAARALCPIETAETVDNHICRAGIIRPQIDPEQRPDWPEAIYLMARKSRHNYTLETPSDYPLEVRVRTHVQVLRRALQRAGA
jgi:hypothetical protein